MKTITISRTEIRISAEEHRALRILKDHGFAAPKSAFEEGPRKWRRYILPSMHRPFVDGEWRESRAHFFGVSEHGRGGNHPRIKRFFSSHPSHQYCILGYPRRINLILRKLEAV